MLTKTNKICFCLSGFVTSAVVKGQWLIRTHYFLTHVASKGKYEAWGQQSNRAWDSNSQLRAYVETALNPHKALENLRAPLEDHLASDLCLDIAKIN